MDLTLEQFALATGATTENASLYHQGVLQACERFQIATPEQMAAFFASMSVETQQLTAMQESLYYRDAEHLARTFRRVFDLDHNGAISMEEIEHARPYCRMPKELSLKLYAGFHGRGGLMLTWEKNYIHHGQKLGQPYAQDPDMLLKPEHAMLSAGSFWDDARCNDVSHDMDEVTRRVNGPARLALAERISRRNAALEVLA